MSDLNGRVAVVTGASAGIGRACAVHFARAGMPVVLGARRLQSLEKAAAEIAAAGGRACAESCDVTVEADVDRLVERAVSTFGRLDVMVCNAGVGFQGTIDETPAAIARRLMDVNYMGTFHGVRAALPIFRRQKTGHFLIVSSIVGRRGVPGLSAYAATKAAQVGLVEVLRAEFVGSSIHASIVYPVSTETEFVEAMRREYGSGSSAKGPRQTADDVARAMLACVRRPQAEVYPFGKARGLAVLSVLAPATCDRFVKRYTRRGSSRRA